MILNISVRTYKEPQESFPRIVREVSGKILAAPRHCNILPLDILAKT